MRKGHGGSLGMSARVRGNSVATAADMAASWLKMHRHQHFGLIVATWWQGARRPRGLSRSQAKYWLGTIHTRGFDRKKENRL